jgi:acyl-CoA thioesterase YciA
MTRDVGFHGNLFGGLMLSWLDEAGVAFACCTCKTPRMVTAKLSEVEFKKPVRPGQIIRIYGKVLVVKNTSINLLIEAKRYSTYNGTEKPVCSTVMTFVRVDGDGEPVPISKEVRELYAGVEINTHTPNSGNL